MGDKEDQLRSDFWLHNTFWVVFRNLIYTQVHIVSNGLNTIYSYGLQMCHNNFFLQ